MMQLIEKVRAVKTPWTDVLDPNGKPYLVFDPITNIYAVLYWRAWFHGSQWVCSGWYNSPPKEAEQRERLPFNDTSKIRVYELPEIEYAPSKKIAH